MAPAEATAPGPNVYAEHGCLVPPKATTALVEHIGTDDHNERPFPAGHIGDYNGKLSQTKFAPAVARRLRGGSPRRASHVDRRFRPVTVG